MTETKRQGRRKVQRGFRAYEVLSDKKRQIYDRYGHAGQKLRFLGILGGGVEDIFRLRDIFGTSVGWAAGVVGPVVSPKGADVRAEMVIDFEEAVFGVEKIKIHQKVSCHSCNGSGGPGSSLVNCATCRRGQVMHGQDVSDWYDLSRLHGAGQNHPVATAAGLA